MLSVTDPMNLNIPQLTAKQKDDTFYFERIDEFAEIAPVISEPFVQILPALQSETHIPDKPVEDFAQIKTKILVFLANGQWHEVLTLSSQALLNHPRKSDLAQFKAKALVNLGLLEKAKQACEDSIRFDELDPHSYLLYGLILLQLNLHDEAEKAFRQTIFLNYDFMEAHYQLGQVLLHKGQQKQGIKAIKNALQLAEEGDGQRPVHNVIALTYASFAESIKNELSVLDKGRGV
jgi:tetratricopeptide (TPR) repeat protein